VVQVRKMIAYQEVEKEEEEEKEKEKSYLFSCFVEEER
jgi:hypothetical protein